MEVSVRKILQNIIDDPANARFRHLKLSNEKVLAITESTVGMQALESAGFKRIVINREDWLKLSGRDDVARLNCERALAQLAFERPATRQSSAVAAPPHPLLSSTVALLIEVAPQKCPTDACFAAYHLNICV